MFQLTCNGQEVVISVTLGSNLYFATRIHHLKIQPDWWTKIAEYGLSTAKDMAPIEFKFPNTKGRPVVYCEIYAPATLTAEQIIDYVEKMAAACQALKQHVSSLAEDAKQPEEMTQ